LDGDDESLSSISDSFLAPLTGVTKPVGKGERTRTRQECPEPIGSKEPVDGIERSTLSADSRHQKPATRTELSELGGSVGKSCAYDYAKARLWRPIAT
jgi:hypothetical protein